MKTNSSTRPSIDIDFSKYDDETQKLKARVCQHATIFCCLSGPDSETGIYGIGKSPGAAIKSWRINLRQRFDRINGQEIQLNSWRSAAFRMVSS